MVPIKLNNSVFAGTRPGTLPWPQNLPILYLFENVLWYRLEKFLIKTKINLRRN